MGEQILIAEDDADINNLLAKILRTEHFKPIQAFRNRSKTALYAQHAGLNLTGSYASGIIPAKNFYPELGKIFLLTYQSSYCLQKLPWQTKCHF